MPQSSDQAVFKATNRTWDEWFTWLRTQHAEKLSHPEIVALLAQKGGLVSAWWQQNVTNSFEKYIGRRTLGQTTDVGFQVGVRRTFPVPAKQLWERLLSPTGLAIWLGTLPGLAPRKGLDYVTSEGTSGQIRSVVPEQKLRLTWKPTSSATSSTLQLYLEGKGQSTALGFHHEKLADSSEREAMRTHWGKVLDSLQKLFSKA